MKARECEVQMDAYQKSYDDTIAYFKQFHGGDLDGYTYVDLGLSVKWASRNFEATTDLESGIPVGWGNLYKNEDLITLRSKGIIDLNNNIKPLYSICSIGEWRLPSKDEFKELFEKCTWTLLETPRYGLKIVGRNGNSIFLPLVGSIQTKNCGTDKWEVLRQNLCGCYWTSTFNTLRLHPDHAAKAGTSKVLTACGYMCEPKGPSTLDFILERYRLNIRLVCDR